MSDQSSSTDRLEKKSPQQSRIKKGLFVVAGTIFLSLGCIGIVLPVLPTTPFLLLSAGCYYRGSERMHHWMLNNKWFGSYIRNYKEGKGLPFKTKIFTLAILWIVIICSALLIVNFIVQVVLFAVAVGVSLHLITLPTLRQE